MTQSLCGRIFYIYQLSIHEKNWQEMKRKMKEKGVPVSLPTINAFVVSVPK